MSRSLTLIALTTLLTFPALARPNSFAATVQRRFSQWDADRDGILSPDEIDKLTIDPTWKADDAAAIATIKIAMRARENPLPSVALATVDKTSLLTIADETSIATADPRYAKRPDTLQTRFESLSRYMRSVRRDLFLDPTPDLDKFQQGDIGDCFFVAIVGGMVQRDPQSVKRMIKTESDGNYTVTFSNFKPVTIPPLTDVEFALVSTTGDEGTWLPVIEKAFGSLRTNSLSTEKALSSTDAIANGGDIGSAIRALTGHTVAVTLLAPEKNPAAADPQKFIATLRDDLTLATKNKRLMGVGTRADIAVPGIPKNHAYAILAYDSKTDLVKLWNPWGNTFRPQGKPGVQYGYPTRKGRLDVPLPEFAKTFRTIYIETDQPFDNSAAPAKRKTTKPSTPK